jgi:hypothetical protein
MRRLTLWLAFGLGTCVAFSGQLFLFGFNLFQSPSLFTFDRVRNGAIAAISGCGVVRDGDVIVDDRTGNWSTWIERSVSSRDSTDGTTKSVDDRKKDQNSNERVLRAKLLYRCDESRGRNSAISSRAILGYVFPDSAFSATALILARTSCDTGPAFLRFRIPSIISNVPSIMRPMCPFGQGPT